MIPRNLPVRNLPVRNLPVRNLPVRNLPVRNPARRKQLIIAVKKYQQLSLHRQRARINRTIRALVQPILVTQRGRAS